MTASRVARSKGVVGSYRMPCQTVGPDSLIDGLELQRVQPGHHGRGPHDPLRARAVDRPGAENLAQHLEMTLIRLAVVPQEARLLLSQRQARPQQVDPPPYLRRAQALDDEHRAEQVDRVRLARLVEQVGRQRLGADVLSSTLDLVERSA